MTTSLRIAACAIILLMFSRNAHATVTEFTSKDSWQTSVGTFSTIGFTEYPDGTTITNQYASEGALFTNSFDFIHYSSAFLNDGIGLLGAAGTIAVSFDTPMTSIGADYPGILQISLYSDGELIYTSSTFSNIISHFGGLISTQTFDAAVLLRPSGGGVYIDDLHFGPPVPGPGALVTIAIGLGAIRRRRR